MDLPNLKELDLSWNEISIISLNAFYKLGQLTKLNLSHNKLKFIPSGVFYFMSTLETISLSWNTELYQQKDFMKSNLFSQFGLSSKLKELKLDNCNLDNLDLSSGTNLQHLSIRSNKFKNIPETTPTSLKYLDISDNPISSLQPLDKLNNVTTLYMEDMSNLYGFNNREFPSFGRKLKYLSIENSRKLHNFIVNSSDFSSLEVLNLRGTMVRSFNGTTMEEMFQKLKEINLNGIPFTCDCDLVWMKDLPLETGAQCINQAIFME
uniref:LRRCT domain-containing protein n=1 Tax=Megaselia scalaris TaxID=36166 RepID=T1GBH7_MEGSC